MLEKDRNTQLMTTRTEKRLKIILIATAFVFSILIIRSANLIFFSNISIKAPENISKVERGFIKDRRGEKLALSFETFSIYARPREIENKTKTAEELAKILPVDYRRIITLLNSKKSFVWIIRQVDLKYRKSIEKLELPGIYLEKEYRRYYPFGNLASHVVGFAGTDNVGLEGVEYYFNSALMPENTDPNFKYIRGNDVILTLDSFVQEIVEEELDSALNSTGARSVTAIVMNVKTGEILALANKPDYDLNRFKEFPPESRRNRAITDVFEPGSTFKIFIASILLDEGIINTSEEFICKGAVKIGNTIIHDTGIHGTVNLEKILQKSCNVGMIKAVEYIDNSLMYDRLRSFGFGSPTGINLPGEAQGILRKPSKWSQLSKYEIAIGQEVAVSALQLISAASAIANGGILMQPRIVKEIKNSKGKIIKRYEPIPIRRVISAETSEKMLEMLTKVLEPGGTGYKAYIEGYKIAGKTGTAQIADTENGGYLENQFYASFVGFLPVPEPKIAILVTLDRPVGEVYGGQTAAPIFKKIVERIAPYLNILPSFSEIYVLNY